MSSVPSDNSTIKSSADQKYTENILSNLSNFFDNQKFSDVVLIAGNDGKRIWAHKLVLSAACEYFTAMFAGSHREAFENEITLHEVNGNVLEVLVKYCYTGVLEYSKDLAEDVLITANLLQLNRAVIKCCDFWNSQLDPANCLGFITFAERYNCQPLVKSATEYTLTHFTEVCENDEFKLLSAEDLKKFLLSDDLRVRSEETVFNALKLWVTHDFNERKKCIPNLLAAVRLPLLSQLFIVENVIKFCNFDECQRPIINALEYHLLPNLNLKIRKRRYIYKFTLSAVSRDTGHIESYTPQMNKWHFLRDLYSIFINRSNFGLSVLEGNKLFFVGGRTGSETLNSCKCLDLNKKTLTSVSSMELKRYDLAVVVLKGSLYAIGGYDNLQYFSAVEKWDPSTQVWNYVASMNSIRAYAGAAVLNDKIYVCGGLRNESQILNTVECYDPLTNVWTYKNSMNKERVAFGVAALNGYLYAVGGLTSEKTVERYEPASNAWTLIASLSFSNLYTSCAILENRLISVGGRNVEEYNPETNVWKKLRDLSYQTEKILIVTKH